MAEVEEIDEIIDGVEEATDAAEEELEELPEEVREEVEAEIVATRTAIKTLSETGSKFKAFKQSFGSCVSYVGKFVAKNLAIGAILWGVNVTLNKLLPHEQKETQSRMRNVIKALCDVINTEAKINKKALDWMKDHENDTIVLDEIELPLESILTKYIKPLVEATDKAQDIANNLQEKVDGKVQFKLPNANDMKKFMDITEVFIKAFNDLIMFVLKHENMVKYLQSFPVKQGDLIDLSAKLTFAKNLPLW